MEQLICASCGPIGTEYYTELKSNQNVARCSKCDRFIKNISYDKPKLYVGKYKDVPIEDINDTSYLVWAIKNMTSLKPKIKEALQQQLDRLEYLAK